MLSGRHTLSTCVAVVLLATISVAAGTNSLSDTGLKVPPDFEVLRFANDDLAHDIFSMTIDARGRVVVSGPGYIRTLIDDDRDGQADRAVQFADRPASGAQGLLFLGNDLLYTGDGGLWLLRDHDGDGVADGSPVRWLKLNHAEHGAHAIAMGPDGWVYVMCGNNSGMAADQVVDPNSPIVNPVAGCVVRLRADGTQAGIVADGFRNPYDMGFNSAGHLFTVDSDGERSHHLPWYTPTRMFDTSLGQQHGWVLQGWQRSWSRPEEFFDNVPRVCELGRGSPSGLVVYRHQGFPSHYHDGVFTACWTLGRVYFIKLSPAGASYRGTPEVFLETAGDVGFAPVDLAVGPAGDLFVAVGGRGTQGGVFRVRYKGNRHQPASNEHATLIKTDEDTLNILNAEQPLSSWSRNRWLPLARELGPEKLIGIATGKNPSVARSSSAQRVRAIEILVELAPHRVADLLNMIDVPDDPKVAARLAWAISRSSTAMSAGELEKARSSLATISRSENPSVQRAAWTALDQMNDLPRELLDRLAWVAAFNSSSRHVRQAAIRTASQSLEAAANVAERINALPAESKTGRMRSSLLWMNRNSDTSMNPKIADTEIHKCLALLALYDDPDVRLECVRLIELWLGDIRPFVEDDLLSSGYALARPDAANATTRQAITDSLTSLFPTGKAEMDREIARGLAMIGVSRPTTLEAIATKWTPESSPVDDVHYLTVLSKIAGKRSDEVTARTAAALVGLHDKLETRHWYPSREWPIWVTAVFDALGGRDSALAAVLVSDPAFGRPDHAMFVPLLPKIEQRTAARRLYARLNTGSQENEEPTWSATLIEALSVLPDDVLFPRLREVWDEGLSRDAIVRVLARSPQPVDRPRFLVALERSPPLVVETAIDALTELPAGASPEEIAVVLGRLRRSCLTVGSLAGLDDKPAVAKYLRLVAEENPMRQQIGNLLRHWTGLDITAAENEGILGTSDNEMGSLLSHYGEWFQWFDLTHPEFATRIRGTSTSSKSWAGRLGAVEWTAGNTKQGQAVYRRKACHQCHDGNAKLGPELAPAVKRFSRDDLFAAVINPTANISPQYQGVQIVTRDGRVYQGLPVYDSPEGLLLRTGPGTTVRLTGDEIELRQPSTRSFMPLGLLDDLSDEELADLYAYLRTLR